MSSWDSTVIVLLLLLGFVLATGGTMVFLAIYWRRRHGPSGSGITIETEWLEPRSKATFRSSAFARPTTWLAIRSRNLPEVQAALGLHHARPCSWTEASANVHHQSLFLSPPVTGWILVIGSRLPEPGEDVDVCFRFLLHLSRSLGEVQFFNANHVLNHHAWVKVQSGKVVRAYAWAGKTLWHQGQPTRAETELGLKCFDYHEPAGEAATGGMDAAAANMEKVPLLAARWSIDPGAIDERVFEKAPGVIGEISQPKPH